MKLYTSVKYRLDQTHKILPTTIIILGAIVGIYVGGYLMFFTGIVNIITQIGYLINTPALFNAVVMAFNIIKIILASFAGMLIFSLFVFIAYLFD